LSVVDKPGTLAKITAILAQGKIGIASVMQPQGHEEGVVPLIMMTHAAPFAAMKNALQKISRTPAVKAPPIMLRVEEFD
jgi:predicted amino acid-binding ACT domain protein